MLSIILKLHVCNHLSLPWNMCNYKVYHFYRRVSDVFKLHCFRWSTRWTHLSVYINIIIGSRAPSTHTHNQKSALRGVFGITFSKVFTRDFYSVSINIYKVQWCLHSLTNSLDYRQLDSYQIAFRLRPNLVPRPHPAFCKRWICGSHAKRVCVRRHLTMTMLGTSPGSSPHDSHPCRGKNLFSD